MLGNSAFQPNTVEEPERPELSPLWGLTLVLGEIAQRVSRRQVEEHDDRDKPEDADDRVS